MSKDKYNLNFMLKKISVARPAMVILFSQQEFVEEINKLIDQNISITDEAVYDIIKKIYFKKCQDRENGIKTDFNFYHTRKALRGLCKAIYGDPDVWRRDYEEFLKTK